MLYESRIVAILVVSPVPNEYLAFGRHAENINWMND